MKLTVTFPINEAEWKKEYPTEWVEKEIEFTGTVNSILPYRWGNKFGLRICYNDYSAWRFTTKPFVFDHPLKID